ncbi:MAG: PHP-associated domain-containing protein, partial [Planctomycetota bacterium]
MTGLPDTISQQPGVTRMDTHCHSCASNAPVIAAAGLIGAPECYSEPEQVYEQARARGMDLVTLTDHDSIAGVMSLIERGFEGVIAGEEITTHFAQDRCKMHVLCWGMTPELHEEVADLGLRDDIELLARWFKDRDLPHAVAHPLYMQNGRLTRWHIERCALLFRGFEMLNGAHQASHEGALERFLTGLNRETIDALAARHELEPVWAETWNKARTAGSDDHGLLNVGRTWTEIDTADEPGGKLTDPSEFMRRAMLGQSRTGGVGGHSALLAHQLSTVGAHYYAREGLDRTTPTGRMVAHKLLRFAGVKVDPPSKHRLAAYMAFRKLFRRNKKSFPLVTALREHLGPILESYPELRERLDPDRWPT